MCQIAIRFFLFDRVQPSVVALTIVATKTNRERGGMIRQLMGTFSLLISAFDAVLLPSLRAAGDPAAGSIAASSVPQCTAWHG